jgi:pimeloyl-ACP methyl ester carboxylesterase
MSPVRSRWPDSPSSPSRCPHRWPAIRSADRNRFVADLWQLTYKVFHNAHDSVAYVAAKGCPSGFAALHPLPLLTVIFGTRDQLISLESAKLFETVPGASVVMIDGAGHSPRRERIVALIKDFLAAPTP